MHALVRALSAFVWVISSSEEHTASWVETCCSWNSKTQPTLTSILWVSGRPTCSLQSPWQEVWSLSLILLHGGGYVFIGMPEGVPWGFAKGVWGWVRHPTSSIKLERSSSDSVDEILQPTLPTIGYLTFLFWVTLSFAQDLILVGLREPFAVPAIKLGQLHASALLAVLSLLQSQQLET